VAALRSEDTLDPRAKVMRLRKTDDMPKSAMVAAALKDRSWVQRPNSDFERKRVSSGSARTDAIRVACAHPQEASVLTNSSWRRAVRGEEATMSR
jgi:hypothetical protein